MNKEEIIRLLKELFSEYFNIKEEFKEENYDKTLTGHFSFISSDLVYLYMLIKETFNITIDSRHLIGKRLNTINGIVKVIMESVLV